MPIEIKDFRPIIDKKWAQEHGFTTVTINAPDNEVFLEYADSGKMLSLHEYFEKIPRNKSESTITNTFKENFENVFLLANGQKIKITAIEIDYIATTPHVRTIKIAPEVKGVVEYLNKKQRILVLQDGEEEIIRTIR